MFEYIFNKAKENKIINEETQNQRDKEILASKLEKESLVKLKKVTGYKSVDYKTDNCSSELLDLIEKYEFKVLAYDQSKDEDNNPFGAKLETYHCEYNNWSFDIVNYEDIDIEEGIFALENLKDTKYNKSVKFYCDLGCRNSHKETVDRFLMFIKCKSEEDFILNEYGYVMEMKSLIEETDLNCKVLVEQYSLSQVNLTIKIANDETNSNGCPAYIRVFLDRNDGVKIVVTNDEEWDSGSQCCAYGTIFGKNAYYIDYKDKSNFDELYKCILCFIEHISGKIGYLENSIYYSNNQIEGFFDSIKSKKKSYDAWNHYKVQVSNLNYEVFNNEYFVEKIALNKYKGLEINANFELKFNDAAQWSDGDLINTSRIKVLYDKRIDENNCILEIRNYSYSCRDDIFLDEYLTDFGIYSTEIDFKFLVDKVVVKGSFTEMMEVLKNYVYSMFEIHNVEI